MSKTVSNEANIIYRCPVCRGARLHYLFSVQGYRAVRCDDCGLLMLNPQPLDNKLTRIDDVNPRLLTRKNIERLGIEELNQAAVADYYLDLLGEYIGDQKARMLVIGGQYDLLSQAAARGFEVTGIVSSLKACETLQCELNGLVRIIHAPTGTLPEEVVPYDICVLINVLERVRNPQHFLEQVHRILNPGGILFIGGPSLDSRSARLLKATWSEFKAEHLFYFNQATLQSLLFHSRFEEVIVQTSIRSLAEDYAVRYLKRYPTKALYPLLANNMTAMARARQKIGKLKLSLVVPVFNEASTIADALDKLLAKQVDGLDVEIIVVESNSTDGTREIVLKYEEHPRLKLLLESQPLGKGHAVRTGLEHISGDFVLIQDADLEYDLEDYDVLLEPLIAGREAFVLGSRHGGRSWKMRQFSDQPVQGWILNLGHWFFTFLINILFGLRLKDPFTMYKVFRRDCLYGLVFECNRFDFDFELLLKLVRKGYKPLEIPVNYRSRSFKQGKKVSIWRDPWTWLRALIKYRFCKIDLLASVEKK